MKKIFVSLLVATLFFFVLDKPTLAAPRIRANKDSNSTNWSGYAVPAANVTDVKGSWVVPTVTCVTGLNTYSSAWVGIDGYNDNSVEQIGTEQDCISGQARYYVWYEMYPKPSRYVAAITPGTNVNAEVKYANGRFVLTLNGFSTTQKSNAQRASAEWIMEAPWSGSILPLANFGTIAFTNAQATINGATGSISNWANDPITMTSTNGSVVRATPSNLTAGGSAFTVTWQNN